MRRDITDMFAFREALKSYGLIETSSSITIFTKTKTDIKEDLEDLLEILSKVVKSNVVIRVGGLDEHSNVVADAYIGESNGFTRFDTFEYCLSTKNGIKVIK